MLKQFLRGDLYRLRTVRPIDAWKLWLLGAPIFHILVPRKWQIVLPEVIRGELYPPLPFRYNFRLPWRADEPVTDGEIAAWHEYASRKEHPFYIAAAFGRQPEKIATEIPEVRYLCFSRALKNGEPVDVLAARCVELWGQNWPVKLPHRHKASRAAIILFRG